MTRNHRSLKNFLIIPQLQLRLCGFTLVVLVAFSAVSGALIHHALDELFTILIQTSRAEVEAQFAVGYAYRYLMKSMAFAIGIVFVIATLCMLVLSHRIAGAAYAINRHIQNNLLKGDYQQPLTLRKRDFFVDIADGLNQLSKEMSGAKGASTTSAKRRSKAR